MTNLEMLERAAKGLRTLKDEVVFVGGATVELYLQDPVIRVRPTDDVDCVIRVVSRLEYHAIDGRLRELGFTHPIFEKVPICRWQYQDLMVDVMPIEGEILGFTNRWYREGFDNSVRVGLPKGTEIRIFTVPYFLASKIEAFRNRGNLDYMGSPDIEDIITILDGTKDVSEEAVVATVDVKDFLGEAFAGFLKDEDFLDAIEGHLPLMSRPGGVTRIVGVLKKIADSAKR